MEKPMATELGEPCPSFCIGHGADADDFYTHSTGLFTIGDDKEYVLVCGFQDTAEGVREGGSPDPYITLKTDWFSGPLRTLSEAQATALRDKLTEYLDAFAKARR